MLKIRLPPEVRATMTRACRRAGIRETGGMLFGEHVAPGDFRVVEATVAGTGTVAQFLRDLVGSLAHLEKFFRRTRHDYQRFNYLGEWHSHPSFALTPSHTDDSTMYDLVHDAATNARFAVSIIVKLADEQLHAAAFTYFPQTARETSELIFENL
jgi:[CysO sulfur-carrier protein]-S-L-cysteine hydrolase